MSYTEMRSGTPVARKNYPCEWCAETIEKGTKHFQRVYRWEGEFNNGRMHTECEQAMSRVPRQLLEDGWIPGDYARGSSA